jgi:hypothetical protein
MESEDLEKEREKFIQRKTRRVLGMKALRQIRGMIDGWEAEEVSERKFIKFWGHIILIIFLLLLLVAAINRLVPTL